MSAFASSTPGSLPKLPAHPNLIDAKIRMGTGNAAREPAMSVPAGV